MSRIPGINSPSERRRRLGKVWWLLTLPFRLSKKYGLALAGVLAGFLIRFGGPTTPVGAVLAVVYTIVLSIPISVSLIVLGFGESMGDVVFLVGLVASAVVTGVIYLWGRRLEHEQKEREA